MIFEKVSEMLAMSEFTYCCIFLLYSHVYVITMINLFVLLSINNCISIIFNLLFYFLLSIIIKEFFKNTLFKVSD